MSAIRFILDWINENPGSALGALLGFVFGILMFTIGFFKMMVLLLLVLIGYVVGKSWDKKVNLLDQIKDFIRNRGR
jgi:uncharacterized membrane protein